MNVNFSVALFFASGVAHGATNLAAICKDATPPTATTCASTIYDVPQAADIVKGNGGYFAQWSLFTDPAAVAVVCPADIARGATSCPVTTLTIAAKAVATALPPTGSVSLSWALVTSDPATSVWLYSGVKGGALGKVKQVSLPATSAVIPGYTSPGVYTFGIAGSNSTGDGPMLTTDYTVSAPAIKLPGKPTSLSITAVTIGP